MLNTKAHQLVPSRMVFDFIDSFSEPIVRAQHWRITICLLAQTQSGSLAHQGAKGGCLRFPPRAAFAPQRFLERLILLK
jgi:hypothetical protein